MQPCTVYRERQIGTRKGKKKKKKRGSEENSGFNAAGAALCWIWNGGFGLVSWYSFP